MSQVDLLYRLQQIDDEIREDKKRLGEVIRLQAESDALLAAQERATLAAAEFQQWRTRQNDQNLELDGLTGKIRRSEDRLYSGKVKNPKELADLQQEIDSLHRRRVVVEDELLEAMIMVEETQEEDRKAAEALEHISTQWEQNVKRLEQEQAELVQRINDLTGRRERQLKSISVDALAAYNHAARRAGAIVVVTLKNGRCQGCQVRVPAFRVKAAVEGDLVTCDSCGRILCPV